MRIEFVDPDSRLIVQALREDRWAAAVPRAGGRLAPAALGINVMGLLGLGEGLREAGHVEHHLTVPGVHDESPLAVAVIRATSTGHALAADLGAVSQDGWHVAQHVA